jgi:hypothetical protein
VRGREQRQLECSRFLPDKVASAINVMLQGTVETELPVPAGTEPGFMSHSEVRIAFVLYLDEATGSSNCQMG